MTLKLHERRNFLPRKVLRGVTQMCKSWLTRRDHISVEGQMIPIGGGREHRRPARHSCDLRRPAHRGHHRRDGDAPCRQRGLTPDRRLLIGQGGAGLGWAGRGTASARGHEPRSRRPEDRRVQKRGRALSGRGVLLALILDTQNRLIGLYPDATGASVSRDTIDRSAGSRRA